MRTLKNGEVRYKPSAYKEAERLAADPLPMASYAKGTKVQVYTGHGWSIGYVNSGDPSRTLVFLAKEQRLTCCCDNRNIRLPVK